MKRPAEKRPWARAGRIALCVLAGGALGFGIAFLLLVLVGDRLYRTGGSSADAAYGIAFMWLMFVLPPCMIVGALLGGWLGPPLFERANAWLQHRLMQSTSGRALAPYLRWGLPLGAVLLVALLLTHHFRKEAREEMRRAKTLQAAVRIQSRLGSIWYSDAGIDYAYPRAVGLSTRVPVARVVRYFDIRLKGQRLAVPGLPPQAGGNGPQAQWEAFLPDGTSLQIAVFAPRRPNQPTRIAYWLTPLLPDEKTLRTSTRQDLSRALTKAASLERPAAVRALLRAGADPNGVQGEAPPLLNPPAGPERRAIAFALLKAGADPNRVIPPHWPPLITAASMKDAGLVRELLRRGASVNARRSDGYTAMDVAREVRSPEIMRLLQRAGARSGLGNRPRTPNR